MSVNEKTGRSLDGVAEGMGRWLQRHYALASAPEVVSVKPVQTGGMSYETLIIGTSFPDGSVRDYVLRAPPPDTGIFPDYSLEREGTIQARLGRAGIPTAIPLGFETDETWIGVRFLLMPRLSGRTPPDFPFYALEGWMKELTPALQRRGVESFLEWLARIHQLDIAEHGLDLAARDGERGPSRLAEEFRWWRNYLDWAADGKPTDEMREVNEIFLWCEQNWPEEEPAPSFLWGDPRQGNSLYDDDMNISGILDFDLMSLGPAEVDLAYWLTYRRNAITYYGGSLPELPGFPDREESIMLYERFLGRKLLNMEWYEMFAAARQGSCMAAIQQTQARRGLPPVVIPPSVLPWHREIMAGKSIN